MLALLAVVQWPAFADGSSGLGKAGELRVEIGQKVIYCAVNLATKLQTAGISLSQSLKDGVPVAVLWHVRVGKVRDYWLNEDIAGITVVRRAVPDLLSRSWLLLDESSGISRRVYSLQESIQFLSVLEHFPVLDRSLLLAATPYRLAVGVEIHTGELNEAWWSGLWAATAVSMQQDFSLP